jgi:hypothetical protein
MGVSTSSGVLVILKKATNSTPRIEVPSSLLGAMRVVYWTLFKKKETMAIFGIQLTTLCEGRKILGLVVTLEDVSKSIKFFAPTYL